VTPPTTIAHRGKGSLVPRGLLVHGTGSCLIEAARRAKADPEEFAVNYYMRSPTYPHYLISHDGDCYSFADDRKVAPHAGWRPWERRLYAHDSIGGNYDWPSHWARDFLDDVIRVYPGFYDGWLDRWSGIARFYKSPLRVWEQVAGKGARGSPNTTHLGVELLHAIPFTEAQVRTLARLFVHLARAHGWLDPAQIDPATLPQPWLLGHSDLCPARRWQRTQADRIARQKMPREGFPFDPLGRQLDWRVLGERIVEEATRPLEPTA
jgi:N-acetyl-anhydromuramyl-L-alanine amidase AmpD